MYSGGSRKQRPVTAGFLARPRLGAVKGIYSSKPFNRPLSAYSFEKKRKSRKSSAPKMDYRKRPDYADTAYREAVGRLRILLAESYTPIKKPLRDLRELESGGEETDNQSLLSGGSRQSQTGQRNFRSSPLISRRYPYYNSNFSKSKPSYNLQTNPEKTLSDVQGQWDGKQQPPPELMTFIERQEDYIEQLERESRFCRDELAGLLGKVKDVISENEHLHEKQKSKLIKSVFDHLETETETETDADMTANITKSPSSKPKAKRTKVLEGPSIVFESRISELEAQLTQTKIDLRKAQDENESYKRKIADGSLGDSTIVDSWKKQADASQREKNSLQDTVAKLQAALIQLRDKENDTTHQVKRSLDVAEQAQYEKSAAEHEIRRLKDELERQHGKLRDAINDQGRRIAEERSAVERRYSQQIDQLNAELGVQWEAASKLQLELDKQRRDDSDLRRDLAQKLAYIEELKKEMQNKMGSLQSDITANGAEKSALEQQVATLQLANERIERQARQEAARLQAETQSLRQRLDRADADLIHSRRENLRLSDQIASLEKEITLNAALSDEKSKRGGMALSTPSSASQGAVVALPPPVQQPKQDREKELSSLIHDMENKHVATVAELEGMIQSQNQLMEKLTGECHILTQRLEEASTRHKEEIQQLQTNLDYLTNQFSQQAQISNSSFHKDEQHNQPNNPRSTTTTHGSVVTSPNAKNGKNRANNGIISRKNSNASSIEKQPLRQQQLTPLESPIAQANKPIYSAAPGEEPQTLPQQYDQQQYETAPQQQQQEPDPNVQRQYDQQQYATVADANQQQYATVEDPNQQQYLAAADADQQQYAAVEDPNQQQYLAAADADQQQYDQQQYAPTEQTALTDQQQYDQQYSTVDQTLDPNQQQLYDQQYAASQETADPNQQQYDDQQQYMTQEQYDQQYQQQQQQQQGYDNEEYSAQQYAAAAEQPQYTEEPPVQQQ